ncbi:MAG: hypothetical protein P4L22_03800 [Candidatus Babeliales bacterium]|nr:hypothetical protein [Candidatus Babeliales bacterium]
MNISKKALLVLVMGSLVAGSKVQADASDDAWKVIAPFVPAAVTSGILAQFIKDSNSQLQNDTVKLAAVVGLAAGHHMTNKDGSMQGFVDNCSRLALVFGSYLISINKNTDAIVSKLPLGIDKLLSDNPGTIGFGTVARVILLYKTLETIGVKNGVLKKN